MKRRTWLFACALPLLAAAAGPLAAQLFEAGEKVPVFASDVGKADLLSAAAGAEDGLLVVWREAGSLFARVFSYSGTPVRPTSTLLVPGQTGLEILLAPPSVAALSSGQYAVAWTEENDSLNQRATRIQLLDASGQPSGEPRTVFVSSYSAPSVTALTSGGFALRWPDSWSLFDERGNLRRSGSIPGDPTVQERTVRVRPDGSAVIAVIRRLPGRYEVSSWLVAPDGTATDPVLVNEPVRGLKRMEISVATGASGAFALSWVETGSGSKGGRKLRLFDPDGTPRPSVITLALPVSSFTSFYLLDLAVRNDGTVLILWSVGSDCLVSVVDAEGNPVGAALTLPGIPRSIAMTPYGWVLTGLDFSAGSSTPWLRLLNNYCGGSSESGLCLTGSRFRVTVAWREVRSGTEGTGTPIRLTGDTGAFWFFSASNYELFVKILDGRAVNGNFWVFYGSLTDVEFDLTVTDSITGEQRTYHNPAGTMASHADTAAF